MSMSRQKKIPSVNSMIREYQEQLDVYEAFASLVASLIKAFLSDAGIRHYATHYRAKSPESS